MIKAFNEVLTGGNGLLESMFDTMEYDERVGVTVQVDSCMPQQLHVVLQ